MCDDATPEECNPVSRTVDISVIATNDRPIIAPLLQKFTITENSASGSAAGTVIATDPDDTTSSLVFIQQTATVEPFAISANGVVSFVPTADVPVLNYEGRDAFKIEVTVEDPQGARALFGGDVLIQILDANDPPILTLDPCAGDANSMCIDVNENEAFELDLSNWATDQDDDVDGNAVWKCCHPSTPYTVADWPSDPIGGGCNTASGLNYGFRIDTLSKLKVNANVIDYEANSARGCGITITIKDKGSATSSFNVHINIKDMNDPPLNLALATSPCIVPESIGNITEAGGSRFDNNPASQQITSCTLTATDQDAKPLNYSFVVKYPSQTNFRLGETGTRFAADSVAWQDINYFEVLNSGAIKVVNGLNYEHTKSVTFSVSVMDPDKAFMETEITINIGDVNEPPWWNIVKTAEFIIKEEASAAIGESTNVVAFDSDGAGTAASWRTITYSILTDAAQVHELFIINPTSAEISPSNQITFTAVDLSSINNAALRNIVNSVGDTVATVASGVTYVAGQTTMKVALTTNQNIAGGNTYTITDGSNTANLVVSSTTILDYEAHRNDEGLRLNLRAKDGEGLYADVTIIIQLRDINEPPEFGDQPAQIGNTEASPYVLSTTSWANGDQVGPVVIVTDPDVHLDDQASCIADIVSTPNNWDKFSIGDDCQIYVRDTSTISLNTKYKLYVQAVDQGRPATSTGDLVPLKAVAPKVVWVVAKSGLDKPIFSLGSDIESSVFSIQENVNGVIANSATTLTAACTDKNVPSREGQGNAAAAACTSAQDTTCASAHATETLCNGAAPNPTATVTGCFWNPASSNSNKCECRDQSIVYNIIPGETLPRKRNVLVDSFTISLTTGELSLTGMPNYEDLLIVDEEIHCTLGKPTDYSDGNTVTHTFEGSTGWPNGLSGICRQYNNDRKKSNNAMDRFGYLDAAHLCAETGSRLPTLSEFKTAQAADPTNFVPNNIFDTCDYTCKKDNYCGNGFTADTACNNDAQCTWSVAVPVSDSKCVCSTACADIADMSASNKPTEDGVLTVWTYNGNAATIGTNTVPILASSQPTRNTALPVLCYNGPNADTTPIRGYSIKVRCGDTGDQTYYDSSDTQLTTPIYNDGQKDDKYVFVQIMDVDEAVSETSEYIYILSILSLFKNVSDFFLLLYSMFFSFSFHFSLSIIQPIYEVQNLVFHVAESATTNVVVDAISASEKDVNDGLNLRFILNNPSTAVPFHLTSLQNFDQYASTDISVNLLNSIPLDYEILPNTYSFTVTVEDRNSNSGQAPFLKAVQNIQILVDDVNETPVLREPVVENMPFTDATRTGYTISEDAVKGTFIGNVEAWDQDANTNIAWSLIGLENLDQSSNEIFQVINEFSDGHRNLGNITLKQNDAVDYETKQTYTLTLRGEDGGSPTSLYAEAIIIITVNNVNDLTITDITLPNGGFQTAGNQEVIFTGTNIGVKGVANLNLNHFTVTYGRGGKGNPVFSATNCAVTNPVSTNTELTCTTAAGYGAGHKWNVKIQKTNGLGVIEGQYNTASTPEIITGYNAPLVTQIVPQSTSTSALLTSGAQILVLTGTNMGPLALDLEEYYATSECMEQANWRICAYTSMSCQVTVANTEAQCTTTAGTGELHKHRLQIVSHDWIGASSSVTTSYASPTITAITSSDIGNPLVIDTWGNEDILITGTNFGPRDRTVYMPSTLGIITAMYSNGANALTYGPTDHCIVTIAQTEIRCTSKAGVGKEFRWKVTVAGQLSPESSVMTRYRNPVINSLGGPGGFEANTAGKDNDNVGEKFYLRGNYFGPATNDQLGNNGNGHVTNETFWNRFDSAHTFEALHCVVITPQTMIECIAPPGVGKNFFHQVEIAYQPSLVASTLLNEFGTSPCYGAPVIASLTRTRGTPMHDVDTRGYRMTPTKTYEVITLTGSNFGPTGMAWNEITASYTSTSASGIDGVEKYDAIDCKVTIKNTEIQCRLATGAGHSHEWSVIVGNQTSQTPTSSYGIPVLDNVYYAHSTTSVNAAKTIGGEIVHLVGNNFGPYPDGATVTYGKDGNGYSPTNCVVITHQLIECTTVPGIGFTLFWSVQVRGQKNDLKAVTSYAVPTIHDIYSIPLNSASAWGSRSAEYKMVLKVNNSALGDPGTMREVKFDTEILQVLPESRQDGESELLVFEVPKLMNGKLAQNIPIKIFAWKQNRAHGNWSSNTIYWSYDRPVISQIAVKAHPTSASHSIIELIGNNFGSIFDGPNPVDNYRMSVLSYDNFTLNPVGNEITMDFLNAPNNAYLRDSFVQKWNESDSGGRFDKIVLIFKGTKGQLSVKRGEQISDPVIFEEKTPVIQRLRFVTIEAATAPLETEVRIIPTAGNLLLSQIRLKMECRNCKYPIIYCPDNINGEPLSLACQSTADGQPRDTKVYLGSISLPRSDLKLCSIIVPAGGLEYNSVTEITTFECIAPAYQGGNVDTRILKDGQSWSAPETTKYERPTITRIERQQGGGVTTTESTPRLLLPTNGYRIKIEGINFGLSGNAQITWDGRPAHEQGGVGQALSTASDPTDFQRVVFATIPPGVGARQRTVTISTGQFSFDYQVNDQDKLITSLAYRAPTIVDVLIPLWTADENGVQGGYIVQLYGYDFDTLSTSSTTVVFEDTDCIMISTSYDTITCRIGNKTSTAIAPATTVMVDSQISATVTDAEKTTIQAKTSAAQNEDEQLVVTLLRRRETNFLALVNANANTALGLQSAMKANDHDSHATPTPTTIQMAIKASQPTAEQLQIVHAVRLIQQAMSYRCIGTWRETPTSKAILDAAIRHDETINSITNPDIIGTYCLENIPSAQLPSLPSGPSAQTGGTGQNIRAVTGDPLITLITHEGGQIFNNKIPTAGGDMFIIKGQNFDRKISAQLIDRTGTYPPILIPPENIISVEYKISQWVMQMRTPPGQGKDLTLQLTCGPQAMISARNQEFDAISYSPPSFNMTLTPNPVKSTTDSCKPNQYESELSWAARIDEVLQEDRERFPELYQRRCENHDTLTLWGENFGNDPEQLKLWVVGKSLLNVEEGEISMITFDVFNGTTYSKIAPEGSVLDRGYGGDDPQLAFRFEYTHNKLVVRGPKGYGQGATLYMSVQGQTVTTPFSFYTPQADYSEPRSYDAQGQSITIHGQNFGGQPSDCIVTINNVPCTEAMWYPEHPIKGLPYIQCNAKRTEAGVANVSVTVAGQTSTVIAVEAVERAGVRTVCMESKLEADVDLETGRAKEFWGRNSPVGELCTFCPEGAACNSQTYEAPISLQQWFIQDLDISGKNCFLTSLRTWFW